MSKGLDIRRSEIKSDRSRRDICPREEKIGEKNSNYSNYKVGRIRVYPIGVFVRVRMISGREIEGQVIKVETTALGTFLHVEFGDEVATVTAKQVTGFYDFCFLKVWMVRRF